MKKTLALLLAALMLFTLAACGGEKTPNDVQTDGETTEATTEAAATVQEVAIAEDVEGTGPAKLYNGYLEVTIPEGYGYYIDDANDEDGEEQFQLILELKNADGKNIGELLINNRGGHEGVDAYVDTLLEEYEGQSQVEESLTCGSFDCRRIMVAINGINVCYYYGYYQIPDETVTYRNVRFELEINEYYYKETGFPTADLEAIMNSIVIK